MAARSPPTPDVATFERALAKAGVIEPKRTGKNVSEPNAVL
jgi:hypothetical protein